LVVGWAIFFSSERSERATRRDFEIFSSVRKVFLEITPLKALQGANIIA
jgi:hypothetical protein